MKATQAGDAFEEDLRALEDDLEEVSRAWGGAGALEDLPDAEVLARARASRIGAGSPIAPGSRRRRRARRGV